MSGSAPIIAEGPDGELVRDVFRAHGLDPHKPEHWVALVRAFADSSRRRAGRAKEWTDDKLFQLSLAFFRAQREDPGKTESDICRILAKRGEFRGAHAETLRRRLHETRDPRRYGLLRSVLEHLSYEPEDGNTPEHWQRWLRTGRLDVYEDDAGNIRLNWPGLVRK